MKPKKVENGILCEENGKLVMHKVSSTWRKKNGLDIITAKDEENGDVFHIVGIGLDKIFKRPSK